MNLAPQALEALLKLWDDPDPDIRHAVENEIKPLCEAGHPQYNEWLLLLQTSQYPAWRRKLITWTEADIRLPAEESLQKWKDKGAVDLLEGWYWLSQTISGEKTLSAIKHQINELFTEIWVDLRAGLHPIDEIETFNHTFFEKLAFQGNAQSYYAEANSLIEDVLHTRTGNPISLCAMYLLIGQRAGIPLKGVNLPNIFVLMYDSPWMTFYINVFNKGEIYTRKQLEAYVQQIGLPLETSYFEPCTPLDMVRRMARNLCVAYEKESDPNAFLYMDRILKTLSIP